MELSSFEECEALCKVNHNLKEVRYTNLELKSSWKQDDGKKISGMSNRIDSSSYFLIIGIDDDGIYLGKNETWAKETEENISNHFNQYLDPSYTCTKIACILCDDQSNVIIINVVNPGALVFWNKKAYKMSGTTSLEMSSVEAMELTVRYTNRRDFSNLNCTSTLDQNLVHFFIEQIRKNADTPAFSIYKEKSDIECLKCLNIFGKNASDILFGTIPARIVFYNEDETVQSQQTLIGLYRLLDGELFTCISQFLSSEYKLDAHALYPSKAFKEAIANAVAHAAYFENSGDIIIEIYKNRIIISNLCLPESGYFANKWFSRSHSTVNNLLMEILRITKYVDELGRGKYLIFSEFIKNGKLPPEVIIESAGRFDRWKLVLNGIILDEKRRKAFAAIKERYGDTEKSQIAFSLVLWQNRTVEEITKYIDGESKKKYLEIIEDYRGPIYFYKEQNKFYLNRWIQLIINQGVESKTLSAAEEKRLFDLAYRLSVEYDEGIITSSRLRELGDLGNSKSATTQSSKLCAKWRLEKKIVQTNKRGTYKFVQSTTESEALEKSLLALSDALDNAINKSTQSK